MAFILLKAHTCCHNLHREVSLQLTWSSARVGPRISYCAFPHVHLTEEETLLSHGEVTHFNVWGTSWVKQGSIDEPGDGMLGDVAASQIANDADHFSLLDRSHTHDLQRWKHAVWGDASITTTENEEHLAYFHKHVHYSVLCIQITTYIYIYSH